MFTTLVLVYLQYVCREEFVELVLLWASRISLWCMCVKPASVNLLCSFSPDSPHYSSDMDTE